MPIPTIRIPYFFGKTMPLQTPSISAQSIKNMGYSSRLSTDPSAAPQKFFMPPTMQKLATRMAMPRAMKENAMAHSNLFMLVPFLDTT